jgi:carbohydrate kinase (thermoresistant glucokinase family)
VSDRALSPQAIVVLGVSGSGKTSLGHSLAKRLSYDFCDGDDLHSATNIEKMRGGQPLTDGDRLPWLNAVGCRVREALHQNRGIVVACSALKRSYRDLLRTYQTATFFVFLDGPPEIIASRVAARHISFMPASLLSSQFAILEPLNADEVGVRIDVSHEFADNVEMVISALTYHSRNTPAT